MAQKKAYSAANRRVGEARRKAYGPASEMPPLHHRLPGEDYDVARSEVVDWLVTQPSIRERVFYEAKQSKLIEYDAEDGVWIGVDWE